MLPRKVPQNNMSSRAFLLLQEAIAVPAAAAPNGTDESAASLKERGNEAFKAFRLAEADALYSRSIDAAPDEAVYYANRSAALFEAGKYTEALDTIDQALSLEPAAGLAAKLCVRAARCALWTSEFDAAEHWLAHPALADDAGGAAAKEVAAHVAACRRAAEAGELGSGLHDAIHRVPEDIPRSTRDIVNTMRAELFIDGQDKPFSALGGMQPSPA